MIWDHCGLFGLPFSLSLSLSLSLCTRTLSLALSFHLQSSHNSSAVIIIKSSALICFLHVKISLGWGLPRRAAHAHWPSHSHKVTSKVRSSYTYKLPIQNYNLWGASRGWLDLNSMANGSLQFWYKVTIFKLPAKKSTSSVVEAPRLWIQTPTL